MSLRFVGRKIVGSILTLLVVLVFNFFLFRIVKSDPVGRLFRGRQRPARGEGAAAPPVRPRQVEVGPVLAVHAPDVARQPRLVVPVGPAGDATRSATRSGRRSGSSDSRPCSRRSSACCSGIKSAWQRNSWFDRLSTGVSMFTYATPDFFLGILLLAGVRVRAEGAPDRRDRETRARRPAASAISSIRRST